MSAKVAYAVYYNNELLKVYKGKYEATSFINRQFSDGIFTVKWENSDRGMVRGNYTLIPCKSNYGMVYVLRQKRLRMHSEKRPLIFPDMNSLKKYLERRYEVLDIVDDKKHMRFKITLNKGILRGKILRITN